MKKLRIENVVGIEISHGIVYPMWSDYGCSRAYETVDVVNPDGSFDSKTYPIEDVEDYGEGYEIEEVMASEADCQRYKSMKKQYVIDCSKSNGNSMHAKPGDTIEVYKGRKFPIGTRAHVRNEYVYRDRYGKAQAWYWRTDEGMLISQYNSIIVEVKD